MRTSFASSVNNLRLFADRTNKQTVYIRRLSLVARANKGATSRRTSDVIAKSDRLIQQTDVYSLRTHSIIFLAISSSISAFYKYPFSEMDIGYVCNPICI